MTDPAALHRLLTWLSPAFPVGAYSYSHGLEYAVEVGFVADVATARDWIADLLQLGAGRCDAIFLAGAWRAVTDGDDAALAATAELAAAFAPTEELARESESQGAAFCTATAKAWPTAAFDRLSACWDGPVAYPVAVGTAAAGHGVPLDASLIAYLHGFTANLVSAAVRLIPLGQSQSLAILAALEPVIASLAAEADRATLADIGSATLMSDWCSMKHETQHTRLFRS